MGREWGWEEQRKRETGKGTMIECSSLALASGKGIYLLLISSLGSSLPPRHCSLVLMLH